MENSGRAANFIAVTCLRDGQIDHHGKFTTQVKSNFFFLRAKTPLPPISHQLSHSPVSASKVDLGDLPDHKTSTCCPLPQPHLSTFLVQSSLDSDSYTEYSPEPSSLYHFRSWKSRHLPFAFSVTWQKGHTFVHLIQVILLVTQLQERASYCNLLKT